MPAYYKAEELVALLDGAVDFWNRPEEGFSDPSVDETVPLVLSLDSKSYRKTDESLEIAIQGDSAFNKFQKAHELCRYLQTRSFSSKLGSGEAGMTKKIIRPRILMTSGYDEKVHYSVIIPTAYKDHLTRFASRGFYKRWRATFLNAAAVRWVQRIFSQIMTFYQATFLDERSHAEFQRAIENIHSGENIYIPTENGSVLQGYETTFNRENNNNATTTAVLVAHGNGECAAQYVGSANGEHGLSNNYFREFIVGDQPTTVQFIDLPGYGLSTGLTRRLKDMEDAYFDAAKQLVDRGHTHVKLVARSLSGFAMPQVALRLQQYVKEKKLSTNVTLYCERTGRSVFAVLMGYILNIFVDAKIRGLDKRWRKSGHDSAVAENSYRRYKRILKHPLLSLNPLQWIGFGFLSALAFVFVYPLAVVTGWQRNSIRSLNKLEKGSYEFFNGRSDGVISRLGNFAKGAEFKTQREIKKLKRKLTLLENNAELPNGDILNEIKHKRLKLWQRETRLMDRQNGTFTPAEDSEHNLTLTAFKKTVSACEGKGPRIHASMKFRLFYRSSETVQTLKRQHKAHKREYFGTFFKPSAKRNQVEFDQYQANKKARHAESAKIADEFFPNREWVVPPKV
jgi:hypothetical protein